MPRRAYSSSKSFVSRANGGYKISSGTAPGAYFNPLNYNETEQVLEVLFHFWLCRNCKYYTIEARRSQSFGYAFSGPNPMLLWFS